MSRPFLLNTTVLTPFPSYNAPEVVKQKQTPIEMENLHKCDIWAYGLLVWEVLANGEIYFKRKWRHDPNYARTARETLSGTTLGDSKSPTTDEANQEESIQPEEEGAMGTFDPKHLSQLAIQFVKTLTFPSFEKGCFGPLFNLTLQEDPAARLSDLNRLPVVAVWNTTGASSLQHKLAMHVGSSEFTFEVRKKSPFIHHACLLTISKLFQGRDIPWEHQVSMLSDFERVANLRQGGEQSTAAAFHVALCYILGFGTKVEYSTATQYLRKAEEQAHPLAQLFGPRLLSRTSNLPIPGILDYPTTIDRGFRAKRAFSKNSKISLTMVTVKTKELEFPGPELDTDAPQPHVFSNFHEFRVWLLAYLRWRVTSMTRWQVTIGNGPRMTFVECAIAFEDEELLSLILRIRGDNWDIVGAWGETPIVQATRRGNAKLVQSLLNAFHDPCNCDEGGASVYHWLFSLQAGNDEPVMEHLLSSLLLHSGAQKALRQACTTPYALHAQWPLQLSGTPLAFAVMSGNLKTVEVLLREGVDPRDPVYAPGEDGEQSKWTALHLATKYHFSQILTALVQRAGEIIRSSDRPFDELGISMVNSRKLFGRQQQWRVADIPEALLAEVLLQFPDLQLPCVLGHVTIVERYGIHGMNYRQSLCDILDILPSKSLEWRSSDGQTALMQAIDYNDYDLASVFLDRSPHLASAAFKDPTEKGEHTWPFHFACQIASRRDSEESTDIANRILTIHPRAIHDQDSRLRTALHMSVTGSSSKVTRFLLSNAAAPDAEDIDGASALQYARSLANVVALLDRGANIDYTNEKGLAAIHIAASIGADDIVAELVKRGAKLNLSNNDLGTPLHCAVSKKSKGSVTSLVQGHAPINARDRENNTPLILAAQNGRHDIVQILLDGGANLRLHNNFRLTPLRTAIVGKSSALVEKLLKHDVSHIKYENTLQSVFHLAAEQADAATMKVLLDNVPEAILSINAANSNLQTPLHVAALAARTDIAEVILQKNAVVDAFDADGATPLLTACRSSKEAIMDANGNRTEFVDLLVKKGATLATHDTKAQQDPWIVARKLQDFTLMAYILEKVCTTPRPGTYPTYIPYMIHDQLPDMQLLETAIQKEEWDFITLCLATGTLRSYHLSTKLVGASRMHKDRLYAYARRGDKAMVQWVFEASRMGTLFSGPIYYGPKYIGKRNMHREFHEARPVSDLDKPWVDVVAPPAPPPPPSIQTNQEPTQPLPFTPEEETPGEVRQPQPSPNLLTSFFSELRRKRSSNSRPSFNSDESGPSSSELRLSPTTTIASSSHSSPPLPHQRTPSFGSSFDALLHRISPSRSGSK